MKNNNNQLIPQLYKENKNEEQGKNYSSVENSNDSFKYVNPQGDKQQEQYRDDDYGNIEEEYFNNQDKSTQTTKYDELLRESASKTGIEITIPSLSDINLFPFIIIAFVLSIVLFFFSIHFDGYKTFKPTDRISLIDARKLFFQGKFLDAYKCYESIPYYNYYYSKDKYYYTATKQLANRNNFKKRIFFALPTIFNNGSKDTDEPPLWIKQEIYELANNILVNNKSRYKYNINNIAYELYKACGNYKDSSKRAKQIY